MTLPVFKKFKFQSLKTSLRYGLTSRTYMPSSSKDKSQLPRCGALVTMSVSFSPAQPHTFSQNFQSESQLRNFYHCLKILSSIICGIAVAGTLWAPKFWGTKAACSRYFKMSVTLYRQPTNVHRRPPTFTDVLRRPLTSSDVHQHSTNVPRFPTVPDDIRWVSDGSPMYRGLSLPS